MNTTLNQKWWQQASILEHWLDDFLSEALRRKGKTDLLHAENITASQLLSNYKEFGFSSLDMVTLASRFAACLGLNHTGLSDLLLARRCAAGWCEVARLSLAMDDSRIGFYSSGSTGRPSLSVHTSAKLLAEAEFFAQLLKPCKRVVCTVPVHHIYGFIWGNLLPQALQVHCTYLSPLNSLPVSWAAQLREHDVIVATPDIWKLLLDLDVALPARFIAISSSAPLAPDVADELTARYPASTQIAVYGSTETAGLAWRYWTQSDYQLLPWWSLSIQSDHTTVCSQLHGEQYTLDDELVLTKDGRFQLLGRLDDVIQIAGHNINLSTLASQLTTHPDIVDANARYQFHAGNHELHYFLALRQRPSDVLAWCERASHWFAQELGDVPAPCSVVLCDKLPKGILDKTQSWDHKNFPLIRGVFRSGFLR